MLSSNFCPLIIIIIEDSIVGEERSLSAYMSSTPVPLLKLVKPYFPLSSGLSGNGYKESVIERHQELYVAKPLHGQYVCDISSECDHRLQWS